MPSGGARLRNGPPADPTALRHKDGADWLKLSAIPADTTAPPWPLTAATAREKALWSQVWAKPQAPLWRRSSCELEVAMHVRSIAEAEKDGASTAQRTLVRQQMDSLLLTMPAMRAAKILIVESAPVVAPATPVTSNRDRLKVLSGGDTA